MFQLSDVPANPQVAAKTLSQMARRDPRVERITKGWYLRVGEPDPAKPVMRNSKRLRPSDSPGRAPGMAPSPQSTGLAGTGSPPSRPRSVW